MDEWSMQSLNSPTQPSHKCLSRCMCMRVHFRKEIPSSHHHLPPPERCKRNASHPAHRPYGYAVAMLREDQKEKRIGKLAPDADEVCTREVESCTDLEVEAIGVEKENCSLICSREVLRGCRCN